MFDILFLLLFANVARFLANSEVLHSNNATDNILCQYCGNQISTSDKITSIVSSSALSSFTDTLFCKKRVLVQILLYNDLLYQFPIITSNQSTCVGSKEWKDSELWFPEYAWKPCFCSECGALVGWIFKKDNSKVVHHADEFYGLILDNLISENCNYLIYNMCLSAFYKFLNKIPKGNTISMDNNTANDDAYLATCEKEFEHRFTVKDEEFMKIFNKKPSIPPILEKLRPYYNHSPRYDRRQNRHHQYNNTGHYRNNSYQRDYNNRDSSYGSYQSQY